MNMLKAISVLYLLSITSFVSAEGGGNYDLSSCTDLLPPSDRMKLNVLLEQQNPPIWGLTVKLEDDGPRLTKKEVDAYRKTAKPFAVCISKAFGAARNRSASLSTAFSVTSRAPGFNPNHNPADAGTFNPNHNPANVGEGTPNIKAPKSSPVVKKKMSDCLYSLERANLEKMSVQWEYSVDNMIVDKKIDFFNKPKSPKAQEELRRIALCVSSATGFEPEIFLSGSIVRFN